MNRLLIGLCMLGWAIYIVQSNSISKAETSLSGSNSAQPSTTETKASDQPELQTIAPAAMGSPHAISPDENPPKAVTAAAPPPQVAPLQNPQPQVEQEAPFKPQVSDEIGEELRVTSETIIRGGPSDSAEVIGHAHTGAKLRVKSREPGWVQFVDPAANKTGWISLAHLAPTEARANAPLPPQTKPKVTNLEQPKSTPIIKQAPPKYVEAPSAEPKPPKPTPTIKQSPPGYAEVPAAKPKPQKPTPTIRQSPPGYAEVPLDQEIARGKNRGLFGLFWKRRISAQ